MLRVPGDPTARPASLTLLVSVLQAGKFNIIPTVINVASGVALMGVVSTPALLPLPSECWWRGEGITLGSCLSDAPERMRAGRPAHTVRGLSGSLSAAPRAREASACCSGAGGFLGSCIRPQIS